MLTVGRVGLDLDLNHPAEWRESRGLEDREMSVGGFLRSDTVANTKTLRSELLEQQGQLVAVTYSLDDHFDGFYILGDVRISTIPASYLGSGLFAFEINLFRIGGSSRVELQSNLTGTVLSNEHGLTGSEVRPFVGLPVGSVAFRWDAVGVSTFLRGSDQGFVPIYYSTGDFSEDASYSAVPGTYYNGAAELWVGGRLRAGLDVPNVPNNWRMTNGITRFQWLPGQIFSMECFGAVGAWSATQEIEFATQAGVIINWTHFSVSRNTPESVIVRLTGYQGEVRHVIDLNLRRGAPFVIGAWTAATQQTTLRVQLDVAAAATAITPTGAADSVGIRQTTDTPTVGHRYIMYTPQTHTQDLTNGAIEVANTTQFRFALGFEILGSNAIAGNTADDVALQYFGYFGERVRAVWR